MRVTKLLMGGIVSGFASLACYAYVVYIDWPAKPADLPYPLTYLLRDKEHLVASIYVYHLGGFIDHQYLWKVEAEPGLIDLLIRELDLQPIRSSDDMPASFWTMPPHWWAPQNHANSKYYKSPKFVAEDRGSDGNHFLLMHDARDGVIYVWFKDNF